MGFAAAAARDAGGADGHEALGGLGAAVLAGEGLAGFAHPAEALEDLAAFLAAKFVEGHRMVSGSLRSLGMEGVASLRSAPSVLILRITRLFGLRVAQDDNLGRLPGLV